MYKVIFIAFCLFISTSLLAEKKIKGKDSTTIFKKVDTTYIEYYPNRLIVKLILVVRTNKFSVKDNASTSVLEYSINTNLNLGLGLNYKGVGVEFQYNPKGLNRDDFKYGKSTQFSLASNAKTRRFIFDAYFRYNQGYHTTTAYKIPNDTTGALYHIYRPDIKNTSLGVHVVYVVNNKHFSSSAPYSLIQGQKKSSGSLLLGGFISLYAVNADSVIFPDSLKKNFGPEAQFKDAETFTYGISCGYTYTYKIRKNWFVNIYLLPALSVQQYFSTNAYNLRTNSNNAIGLAFQSRLAIGYNCKKYFFGMSFMSDNFAVNNDKKSSLSYKFGGSRIYYGYRFDASKIFKRQQTK